MIGYRKKVQPLFDGTFDTSDDAQTFVIVQNGTRFELHYKSNLSEWSETLVSLNETRLVLGTSKGLAYHYKKFESLTLDEE